MKVGIAGLGFMGMVHYLCYEKINGLEVAAIATRCEKKRAGDWTSIKGNFGPRGTHVNLRGVQTFTSAEEMIAEADLDFVDLCLPPGMHPRISIAAFKAGRHVFCEKPIALSVQESLDMVATADACNKTLLIGHVLPFNAEYAKAYEIVTSERYGKLLGGNFKRVISDPAWLPHFYDPVEVGGPMLDLHVHDAHFIRMLFGMPVAVTSSGRMRGDVAEFWNTQFHFEDAGLVVTATSGVIAQPGRSFTHGFEIYLEKATLTYEFAVVADKPTLLIPFTIYDSDGRAEQVCNNQKQSGPFDAFERELREAVRALESGKRVRALQSCLALDAVMLCHAQTDSIKTGSRITIPFEPLRHSSTQRP